jgi:organic radical activating enzyme
MKFSTFSIVVGGNSCNQNCPFCVSKITGDFKHIQMKGRLFDKESFYYRNFIKACRLAQMSNVSTVLLTGKGEPFLERNIENIDSILEELTQFNIPIVEVQTNGQFLFNENKTIINMFYGNPFKGKETHFKRQIVGKWNKYINTIALSVIHYDTKKAQKIIPNAINLKEAICKIHKLGTSIRVSCMLMKGGIETIDDIFNLINFCQGNNVEQLTIRNISNNVSTNEIKSYEVYDWIEKHKIASQEYQNIVTNMINKYDFKKIVSFPYGATVYDFNGMNICFSNCLTHPEGEEIRQLIFANNGHLYYDWDLKGSIIF